MTRVDDFDPTTVTWVLDDDDLEHLNAAIETGTEVVMDLETTGLDEHAVTGGESNGGVAARVVLASFTIPQSDDAGPPTTWVFPLSHPESPWSGTWRAAFTKVAQALDRPKVRMVNHHLKFDLRWLYAHTRVDLSRRVAWDTQIGAHLLDENQSTALKEVVPRLTGVERWDDFDLRTPGAAERVPMFDLGLYAARDTYWTWWLARYQRRVMYLIDVDDEPWTAEEVEDARLGNLSMQVAMPTVATLTSIEQRGLRLDADWAQAALEEHEAAYQVLFDTLASRYVDAGCSAEDASFAPTSLWFGRWAEVAVEQGDLKVAALTPRGKPQWSRQVLGRQARNGSEVARDLLELRGHSKKAEFLRSWLAHQSREGRIHATYNAGTVRTGRLSSSDPNLQQVTKVLRPAFIPSEGYYLADLDYSQIELRVAAFISRCQPMIDAFHEGADLHTMLAQRILIEGRRSLNRKHLDDPTWSPLSELVPDSEVTPDDRQKGKSANFGLLYGMGTHGFREYAEDVYGVVMTLDEAAVVHHAFFEMWDGIAEWHNKQIRRVHDTGQVVSPIGRVRRLPGIWDGNPSLVSYSERAAINAPVQGFASDLMQIAAASIEGTLPGSMPVPGARLVGTVHDSILVEVPISTWQETTEECVQRMVSIHPTLHRLGCDFDVPLVADASVGTRWGLSDVNG